MYFGRVPSQRVAVKTLTIAGGVATLETYTPNNRVPGQKFIVDTFTTHPHPGLHGRSAVVSVALVVFVGSVIAAQPQNPHLPAWRESAMESILTLSVWLVVFEATRRVLRRFHYLEDMLTMCSWCRKLDRAGDWLSLEDYCVKELGVDISHGICPSCGRRLMNMDAPVETTR